MTDYAGLEKRLRERKHTYSAASPDGNGGSIIRVMQEPDLDCTEAADAIASLTNRLMEARSRVLTAIGSLDDPTGPTGVEDARHVRDVVLIDALNALHPPDLSRALQSGDVREQKLDE